MYSSRLSYAPNARLGLRLSSSPTSFGSLSPSPTLSAQSSMSDSSSPTSPRSLFSLLSPHSNQSTTYFLRKKKSIVELELEEEKRDISSSLVSLVEPRPQGSEGDVLFGGIEEALFGGRI